MNYSIPVHLAYMKTDRTGFPLYISVQGVLRLTDKSVEIEFEESWRDPDDFTRRRAEPRVVSIPVDQVTALNVRRRWLRKPLLILDANSISALKDFPGRDGSRCTFVLMRDAAADARALATEFLSRVADAELRRLDASS